MGVLDGQVALITAAGGAIGRATAVRLAGQGAAVACADVQAAAAEATAAAARAAGGEALALTVDALDAAACEAMVATVVERLGRLDILCNLVGYFGPRGGGSLDEVDLATWDWMMEINLTSVFLAARAAIPAMLAVGGGAIINTGTLAAVIGRGGGAYGAAKSGVLSLTRAMASDYQAHGIRVNCVCPSATDTPMYFQNPTRSREEVARTVQGLATPDQMADAFFFLAAPTGARVTGHILMADFGFSSFRQ